MAVRKKSKEATKEQKAQAEADEKTLELMRKRFRFAVESQTDIRKEARDDVVFSIGDQWPKEVKQSRDIDQRPCLVINKVGPAIHQVTNDQRQNRPSAKVSPVDDKADIETAKIYQGLLRHIEVDSSADIAYDTCFDQQVRSSFGFYRAVTEYEHALTFNQVIKIKRIPDQFKCYLDASSRSPDGSDADHGWVIDDIELDEFKRQFPNAEAASAEDFADLGEYQNDWINGTKVRVAEYFYKDFKEVEIHLLSNGSTIIGPLKEEHLADGVEVKRSEKRKTPVVKWCKVSGKEILERADTVWDLWLPLFPAYGDEIEVDGKRYFLSLTRVAKDPQRIYNYMASSEAETIALAPRAPYIGAAGQFEGFEGKWAQANKQNVPYLEFEPKSVGGTVLPAPARQVYEPAIQAITIARGQADGDIKAATGIFDASLGAQSNETSGRAINARNVQAQTSNYHFADNFHRTLRHSNRVILRAIPRVYDAARAIRILGEDNEAKIVKINEVFQDNGQDKFYSLNDAGQYDVTIDTGPSFATKRQETSVMLQDFLQKVPTVAPYIVDLVARYSDFHGSEEIANRLKKTLPPGIGDDDKDSPVPPQIKAQMDQMGQLVEQLTKELNAKNHFIETKQLELESRERIAAMNNQTQLAIEQARISADDRQAVLAHEISAIQHRMDLLHAQQPIGATDADDTQEFSDPAGSPGAAQAEPTGGQSPGTPMEQS